MKGVLGSLDLVYDFAHGTTDYTRAKIVATSKNFVVFKISGHREFADRMDTQHYYQTQYILELKGVWFMRESKYRRTWTGRTSRNVLHDALNESEAKYSAS